MSEFSAPIDLAHEPAFALGGLTVRPSTREVADSDGKTEVLEPRVMQVLVALHRAGGAIVSRDDLTHSCWEGRVVGEDAINRVISRLRRTAEGIGKGAFRIETVTKVGYRLVVAGAPPRNDRSSDVIAASQRVGRRRLIGGVASAAGAAALGVGWWWARRAPAGPPADIAELLTQARLAIVQLDRASEAQAVGLYRRAVELRPDYADAWGQLAYAYVMLGQFSPPDKQAAADIRAREAAARALSLDPDNPFARLALVLMRPLIGNWLALDRVTRAGLARRPGDELLLLYQSGVYTWTGRCRESAAVLSTVIARDPPGPGPLYSLVTELWASDQLDDADRVMDQAFRLFPLTALIWFARFWLLTYSGRAAEALTMSRDTGSRPSDIPENSFALIEATAQAMLTRATADIDAAVTLNLAQAKMRNAFCVDAIFFTSTIGRLDDAFALVDALFFDRPYRVGPPGPMVRIGAVPVRADRNTIWLFTPPIAAMRADPRFAVLMRKLGLDDYWRRSGSQPDYRRAT